MRLVVEGRPMDDHSRRNGVPLLLYGRIKSLPGSDGTKMHILLGQLRCSAREFRMLPVLVEAFPVTVIESHVPDGAITVLYRYGWYESGHNEAHF